MIGLILVIGFILRLISLNQSLWLDEAINVLATQKFSLLGMISEYAKADFHPPLFFIILWIWTNFFGIGEVVVRIPSVIFGILTIYIIYLLGRKLHSKTLGLFSALLLAINPLHIYYSQEARMYALTTLAVVLNFFLLSKLLKRERVNLFALVASNLFILSSDYVAYLTFPAQLIFLLIFKYKKILKNWVIGLNLALLLWVIWLPMFLNQLEVGAITSANLPTWKFVVGGFDIKSTVLTLVKFIIGRISLADKLIYYLILLPVCSFFLLLIFKGIKFLKGSMSYLLIIWLIVPIILATIISFIIPIYSYFRMLFTLPAFVILIAGGILSYKFKSRYLYFILVLSIQIFSAFVYLFNGSYQREDWRAVVNYLKSVDKNSQVLFESSGTLPPFDYYARNSLNAKGALKDFPARSSSDLISLEDPSRISAEIYLVNYLVDITDPNRLVNSYLIQLGYKLFDTKDFHGVGLVYHYVK